MPAYHYKHYRYAIGLEYFWSIYYTMDNIKPYLFLNVLFITRYLLYYLLDYKNLIKNEMCDTHQLIKFKSTLENVISMFLDNFNDLNYKKTVKLLNYYHCVLANENIFVLNRKLECLGETYDSLTKFIEMLSSLMLYFPPCIVSEIYNEISFKYNMEESNKIIELYINWDKIFNENVYHDHIVYGNKVLFDYLSNSKLISKYKTNIKNELEKISETTLLELASDPNYSVTNMLKHADLINRVLLCL
ncbi:hypothetical protein TCON_0409 [Astathelohania contejeani]|uniref:Methionyl/Valyl/Leucyl/Isoleucyl-tRNA synthetase anticodon-binding domain-containing protein n=1 Tax=Astathelohania contejeani TaxID=164912 RepID=A0ABQ7I1Y4_9MICR|nr:hypothetical protein TCON_0409 [Thelohania contejeani]